MSSLHRIAGDGAPEEAGRPAAISGPIAAPDATRRRHALIVGSGVVGFASGIGLLERGFSVTFCDTNPHRRRKLGLDGYETTDVPEPADIYIACVPSVDIDLIEVRSAAREIGGVLRRGDFCILRSTVPPGTTRTVFTPLLESTSGLKAGKDFHVLYEPEFLRAEDGNDPVADELNPHLVLVGEAEPGVAGDLTGIVAGSAASGMVITDFETAEFAKMVHNAFNAAKISFFNEVWQLAGKLGIDGNLVNKLVSISAEASWNEEYGIVGGRAYGGACLPKDVELLLEFCREKNLDSPLLAAVQTVNRSLGGR